MPETDHSRKHIALYRKYRPQKFDDVIGQDHVVKTLGGAVTLGNISHAYLFSGSRGTGKTSVARIFAQTLGCAPHDVYEIDAASNRGIDDIRELRDSVRTLPFDSPYKVYIIDEVHMLTKDAFNALLKTLEEPPMHVIFVLATTEPHKILDTVVSRCQVFDFKKPDVASLIEAISRVVAAEGKDIDPKAAELIALLGDGSFRDTLGVLQKVLSSSAGKKISREYVEELTGSPSGDLIVSLLQIVAGANIEEAFKILQKIEHERYDIQILLQLLIHRIRHVLLLRFAPNMQDDIQRAVGAGEFAVLEKLKGKEGARINASLLRRCLAVYEHSRTIGWSMLSLELVIIEHLADTKE